MKNLKNLLSIVLITISINVFSQDSETRVNDAVNNVVYSSMVSAGSNLLAYETLSLTTDMSVKKKKVVSTIIGIGVGAGIAFLREQNDLKQGHEYNTDHVKASLVGAAFGGSVTLLIPNKTKKTLSQVEKSVAKSW